METTGISNVVALSRTPGEDYFEDAPQGPQKADHALDSEENERLYRKLRGWFDLERERQAANRFQMALDEDFYDGLQYADEDILELEERGQAPLVFNEIKPHVDWLIGSERRARVDWRVDPREEGAEANALVKTKVMKFVSDVNKIPFKRSQAWEECVKAGLGWLEDGVRKDPTDDPLYSRAESWRNMIYDSNSVELDLSDARYLFRWKWVDLDVACAMFPDREYTLRRAAVAADQWGNDQDDDFWYLGQRYNATTSDGTSVLTRRTYTSEPSMVNNKRSRVKLYECWYREPVKAKKIRGGVLDGRQYREDIPAHKSAVEIGDASVYDAIHMAMKVCLFSDGGLLDAQDSPYEHDQFPFTPVWCYRRKRDNAPYGVIRNLRDPQEDLNKRASKALHILSTKRVIVDDGAVEDIEDLREEAARPDGILVKKRGTELVLEDDRELAAAQVQLMDRDAAYIERTSGVVNEQLGRDTNAQSGKAILAKQSQGSMVTAAIFDNLRLAVQLQGEKQLSLIEQFYTTPKTIRLAGETAGKYDWVKVNQPQVQPDGSLRWINDLTASRDDFVVDEQDFHATLRQAMFEQLMEMLSRMAPEIGIKLLHFAVDFSDLPRREEFVKELKKLAGYVPPRDAQTPEEQKEFQAMEAAAQEQQEFAKQMAMAELAKKTAEAKKADADAAKTAAEALQIRAAVPPDPENPELKDAQARLEDALNTVAKLEQALADTKAKADDKRYAVDRKAELDERRMTLEDERERERMDREERAAKAAAKQVAASRTLDQPARAEPARTAKKSTPKKARKPRSITFTDPKTGKKFTLKATKGEDGGLAAELVTEDGTAIRIDSKE